MVQLACKFLLLYGLLHQLSLQLAYVTVERLFLELELLDLSLETINKYLILSLLPLLGLEAVVESGYLLIEMGQFFLDMLYFLLRRI